MVDFQSRVGRSGGGMDIGDTLMNLMMFLAQQSQRNKEYALDKQRLELTKSQVEESILVDRQNREFALKQYEYLSSIRETPEQIAKKRELENSQILSAIDANKASQEASIADKALRESEKRNREIAFRQEQYGGERKKFFRSHYDTIESQVGKHKKLAIDRLDEVQKIYDQHTSRRLFGLLRSDKEEPWITDPKTKLATINEKWVADAKFGNSILDLLDKEVLKPEGYYSGNDRMSLVYNGGANGFGVLPELVAKEIERNPNILESLDGERAVIGNMLGELLSKSKGSLAAKWKNKSSREEILDNLGRQGIIEALVSSGKDVYELTTLPGVIRELNRTELEINNAGTIAALSAEEAFGEDFDVDSVDEIMLNSLRSLMTAPHISQSTKAYINKLFPNGQILEEDLSGDSMNNNITKEDEFFKSIKSENNKKFGDDLVSFSNPALDAIREKSAEGANSPSRVVYPDLYKISTREKRSEYGLPPVSNNERVVMSEFKSLGIPPVQSAALLATISSESKFNPEARGDNGKSFGLFQWKDKRRELLDFALGASGITIDDTTGGRMVVAGKKKEFMMSQLRYFFNEISKGPEAKHGQEFFAATTVDEAMDALQKIIRFKAAEDRAGEPEKRKKLAKKYMKYITMSSEELFRNGSDSTEPMP